MKFRVDSYIKRLPDMMRFYHAHNEEVAVNHSGFPLDLDFEQYIKFAEQGRLHVVTAWEGDELVGYQQFIISTFLHYKSTVIAVSDLSYLAPAYRRGMNGYNLLKFAVESLPKSINAVTLCCKTSKDFGKLIERLGFSLDEKIYIKVVGNE